MACRGLVRRALASPLDGTLASRFAAPGETVIVAEARGDAELGIALVELVDALVHVGVARGRMVLLLANADGSAAAFAERRRELASVLGCAVIVHDPERSTHAPFPVPGWPAPLELDDELREAEAIVLVGEMSGDRALVRHGGPFAILPGLASRASAEAFRAASPDDATARARATAAAEALGVDFALLWDEADPPHVVAGSAAAAFTAGFAAPPGART